MRSESTINEIQRLETELSNQTFRYHLAIKDGAVTSVINEVLKKIYELEKEINQYRDWNESTEREITEHGRS